MQQRDHLGARGHQGPADRGHQGVEAALLADGDATAQQGAGGAAQAVPVPDRAHELGVAVARRHPAQLPERRRPQDAVHGEPRVALEVGQGLGGEGPEDAVDATGVEAEGRQPSLQVGDVVAAQHGAAEVEEAVPEAQARLDQGRPGLGAADAVDAQAPAVLEALDGGLGPGPEDAVGVGRGRQVDQGQPSLQVGDGLALLARGERERVAGRYRYACSSWRSWALPRAPMIRSSGSPSLNSIRVGMLITS